MCWWVGDENRTDKLDKQQNAHHDCHQNQPVVVQGIGNYEVWIEASLLCVAA